MVKNQKTVAYASFAEGLAALLEESGKRPLSLGELVARFSGKGKILLLIFFCIPFGQIFGLAILFGLVIAYLGLRYAFGKRIWLPQSLLQRKIHPKIVQFTLKQILFFLKKIRNLSYPRYTWACNLSVMKKMNGILIACVGVCLAISLPIPFSAYIASIAIFFIGMGLLNEDGLMMYIGYFLALVYICFVVVTLKYISISQLIGQFIQ